MLKTYRFLSRSVKLCKTYFHALILVYFVLILRMYTIYATPLTHIYQFLICLSRSTCKFGKRTANYKPNKLTFFSTQYSSSKHLFQRNLCLPSSWRKTEFTMSAGSVTTFSKFFLTKIYLSTFINILIYITHILKRRSLRNILFH